MATGTPYIVGQPQPLRPFCAPERAEPETLVTPGCAECSDCLNAPPDTFCNLFLIEASW